MSDCLDRIERLAIKVLPPRGAYVGTPELERAIAVLRDADAEAERRGELKGLEAVVHAVEIAGYGRAGAIDFVRARIAELERECRRTK